MEDEVNIYSILQLLDGEWDRNALKMAWMYGLPMPRPSYYKRFQGASKSFKRNKRRR